jgi:hypothetical protein
VSGNWDREGRVQDWEAYGGFSVVFRRATRATSERGERFERFLGQGFRQQWAHVFVYTEWVKWLTGSLFYRNRKTVNFFPAEGLDPFLANGEDVEARLTFRPSPRLRFDQTYIFSRLTTRAQSEQRALSPSSNIFNTHLLRSKLNYQFSRELSLRMILDYNAVLPNPTLVGLQRTKKLTGDVLLTYLLNPGTAVYVGYTDIYENLLVPGTSAGLIRTASPNTSVGRQFFVKFSYLFRF